MVDSRGRIPMKRGIEHNNLGSNGSSDYFDEEFDLIWKTLNHATKNCYTLCLRAIENHLTRAFSPPNGRNSYLQ